MFMSIKIDKHTIYATAHMHIRHVCIEYYTGTTVYITKFLGVGAEFNQTLMDDY